MTDERSTEQPEVEPAPGDVTQPAPAVAGADVTQAPPATDVTQPAPEVAARLPEPASEAAPVPPADLAPVAAPAPAAASAAPPPPARGRSQLGTLRSIATGLVFVLTCLSLVVATTDWWINRTFVDTEAFVAVVAPLVDDPDVQEALAQATADRVAEAIDLGPLGSYVAVGIARELYGSDAFAQLWEQAMRQVHTILIAVLRDESNVVDMVDDQVYINLYPFLDRILDRLGTLDISIRDQTITLPVITDPSDPAASRAELEAALGRPLPETFGVIPVARGDRLVAAQQAFALFETSIVILAVVTLILAILTIVLARRRIRMIALLGVGALASLLLARLAIAALQDAVADALTGGGDAALIGNEIITSLVTSYRELTQIALLLALLAAVVATAVAWVLDRRARAEGGVASEVSIADGWFLAIAGLCIALAALILVGLTLASFAIVALAYVAWVVIVVRTRRRAPAAAAV